MTDTVDLTGVPISAVRAMAGAHVTDPSNPSVPLIEACKAAVAKLDAPPNLWDVHRNKHFVYMKAGERPTDYGFSIAEAINLAAHIAALVGIDAVVDMARKIGTADGPFSWHASNAGPEPCPHCGIVHKPGESS